MILDRLLGLSERALWNSNLLMTFQYLTFVNATMHAMTLLQLLRRTEAVGFVSL